MDLEHLFEKEEEDQVYLERILEYIDDTIAEDDMFMETLVEKFEGLTLYWELPWYQQSRNLIKKCQEVRHGDMYRTDKICQDEKDHIHKRWKKLVKRHGIPDKPKCLARWTNITAGKNKKYGFDPKCVQSAKLFVIAFLARGLRRTLHQVHFYFVSKHIQLERTKLYSRNEDRVIEIFMKLRPDDMPLSLISKALGRKRRHIYSRSQYIKNGIDYDKPRKCIRWNVKKASNFLNALLEETGVQLNELKDRHVDDKVWRVLHEKFAGAKRFWYDKLHVQLFIKREVKLNRFRRKIFKTLINSSYRVWLDINWEHLTKQLLTRYDGITNRFTYKVAYSLFFHEEKMLYEKSLPELIQYALNKTKSPTNRQNNRRLKRMMLTEEGHLIWATTTVDGMKSE